MTHQIGKRVIIEGRPVDRARDHRHLAHRHRRFALTAQHFHQQRDSALSCLILIGMRVRLPCKQRVSVFYHFRRDVRVQVEGDDHRNIRANQCACDLDHLTFRVINPLRQGRPVQR